MAVFHSEYTIAQIAASIGKSPIVDATTKHWLVWDIATSAYVDTGVYADGQNAATAAEAAADRAEAAAGNAEALQAAIYGAYPTAQIAEASVASIDDGANGIPIKSASVTIQRSFVVDPNIYLAPEDTEHGLPNRAGQIINPRFRCIVFPAAPETEYVITSAISTGTMRAASFPTHPVPGDAATAFVNNTSAVSSVTIETGAVDHFVVVQFLIDTDDAAVTLPAALGEGFSISPAPEAWHTTRLWRTGKNLFDPNNALWHGWTTDGVIGTNNHLWRSSFFRVSAGTTYVWQQKNTVGLHLYMVWFSIDGELLRVDRLPSGDTYVTKVAPTGAWWASVSFYENAGADMQIAQETTASSIEAFSGDTAMSDAGLTTAYGKNSIYAAGGTLDVTYRADITMYLDNRE